MFTTANAKFHVNNAIQAVKETMAAHDSTELLERLREHAGAEIINRHRAQAALAGCGSSFDTEYTRRQDLLLKEIAARNLRPTRSSINPVFQLFNRSVTRDELPEALQQLQATNTTDEEAVAILQRIVPAKTDADFFITNLAAVAYFAQRDWQKALLQLLNQGANPSAALYTAVAEKKLPLVNLLIAHGANPEYLAPQHSETALDLAQSRYNAAPDDPTTAPMLMALREAPPLQFDTAVPEAYLCPISKEIMTNPHITANGQTYEYNAIAEWLKGRDKDPLTNHRLANKDLIPNFLLKSVISDWIKEHALPATLTPAIVPIPKKEPKRIIPQSTDESLEEETINSEYPNGLVPHSLSLRVYEASAHTVKHQALPLTPPETENFWINLTTLNTPMGAPLYDVIRSECSRILSEVSPSRIIYTDDYLQRLCSSVRYATVSVALKQTTQFAPVVDLEPQNFQSGVKENYVLALSYTENSPAVRVDRILACTEGAIPCVGQNNSTDSNPRFTAAAPVHVVFLSFKPIGQYSFETQGLIRSGYADDRDGILLKDNEAFMLAPDSIQMISINPLEAASYQPNLRSVMKEGSKALLATMQTKTSILPMDRLVGRGKKPEEMIRKQQRLQASATQALVLRIKRPNLEEEVRGFTPGC